MPHSTVIPVLRYPDVRAAVEWLARAFGFEERLRIGDHRAQLRVGEGDLVITEGDAPAGQPSVMVRIASVDVLVERAVEAGALVLSPPMNQPYGERQCSLKDPAGYAWTFSETIADVDPQLWGGVLVGARED